MRLGALATALMLTAGTPAFAQNLNPLYEALNKLPAVLLTNPEPAQAYFVDTHVLRLLRQGTPFTAQNLQRAQIGAMIAPMSALYNGNVESWSDNAGIGFDDVRYFAGFGQPPYMVSVWGLAESAAATGLIDTLLTRDFTQMGENGIVGNGKPLAADLSNRDRSNPWRSSVGAATFAAAKGNVLVQSTTPDALPMMLGAFDNLEANAVVATMTSGLETAVGDHMIVQAMLISPTFGMSAGDPMALLLPQGDNFDEIRENLEAHLEAGMQGIPPYLGGIIVDAQSDHPAVAISLAYTDCETAEIAAGLMEQRWTDTMPEAAHGSIETDAVGWTNGLCAATLKVTGDSTDQTANPIFSAMFEAYMRRDFSVLQIGEQ